MGHRKRERSWGKRSPGIPGDEEREVCGEPLRLAGVGRADRRDGEARGPVRRRPILALVDAEGLEDHRGLLQDDTSSLLIFYAFFLRPQEFLKGGDHPDNHPLLGRGDYGRVADRPSRKVLLALAHLIYDLSDASPSQRTK